MYIKKNLWFQLPFKIYSSVTAFHILVSNTEVTHTYKDTA